jgi:hypothetical protein
MSFIYNDNDRQMRICGDGRGVYDDDNRREVRRCPERGDCGCGDYERDRDCGCRPEKRCPELITVDKKLPGVKFELIERRSGCVVACGITNSCGELEFGEIPFGCYQLREVDAPPCYEPDCRPIDVEITCDHPHKLIEVVNRRKQGSIKVLKTGKEDVFDYGQERN